MTDKLKFVPRADLIVRIPFAIQFTGQAAPYVGRSRHMLPGGSWGYPADRVPYEVDEDSKDAARLKTLVRRDECLWPFDEATAAACGVKFVAVEWVDGEWVPTKQSAKLKKVANEG